MKNKAEVLAPAGNMEALKAAVNAGADAVYMGYGKLNARRNAKNFTEEEFFDAVEYCKERGVRVNLAVNTVVYDRELELARETITLAAKAGVDALIVQDMGVIYLCKQICPSIPLHASTQLTIHNVSGAKQMKELGFSRVVLAREMSKQEILSVINTVGIETEVFVHGALCMCVSGQCYMSSVIGERSGNRGLCAQPCRLPFEATTQEAKTKAKNGYALSLKDLSILDNLVELEKMGVTSFKIEGRMKRPEYVYSAVEACRNALNKEQVDYQVLKTVFSRSGFTNGYYYGKITPEMFGTRQKQDVQQAPKELAKITPKLSKEYQRVPIRFEFSAKKDEKAKLVATDSIHTVCVLGDIPEVAKNRPTDEASVTKSLMKLGGTYFKWDGATIEVDGTVIVPVSQINALRRKAIALLEKERRSSNSYPVLEQESVKIDHTKHITQPKLYGVFHSFHQMSTQAMEKLDRVIVPIHLISSLAKEGLPVDATKFVGLLPRVAFGDDVKQLSPVLQELKELGITKVMATNIGFVGLAKELGFEIIGDFGLNITNSLSLKHYHQLGLKEAVLSFELSIPRARDIDKNIMPTGLIAYGRLPLMVTRNCPLRASRGCKNCNEHNRFLQDRTGAKYKVVCHGKQFVEILNEVPLYLGDKKEDLRYYDFVVLSFTDEDATQVNTIIDDYKNGEKKQNVTRGLYYRNVL